MNNFITVFTAGFFAASAQTADKFENSDGGHSFKPGPMIRVASGSDQSAGKAGNSGAVEAGGTVTRPDKNVNVNASGELGVIDAEGNITAPDGTVTRPDGTVIGPDGAVTRRGDATRK